MKKTMVALLGTSVLALSASPAMAGQGEPTPGEPNCVGQVNAFAAQYYVQNGFAPGIASAASVNAVSVKEFQAHFREVCSP